MRDYGDIDIPGEVLELVEFSPIEDIILQLLHDGIPSIPAFSLVPDDPPMGPFILARRIQLFGQWDGDQRFVDRARFAIHVYAQDPDGDEKGALISEAIRVIMRRASAAQPTYPGLGTVSNIRMVQEPIRRTDWATSSGPVQYADLPTGGWRYETQYALQVRKPTS